MAEGDIGVLIVDDQASFRWALRAVVSRMTGFKLVGEAASGEEAVELTGSLEPGLVLMDVNMAGINGIEATRQITSIHPHTLVILLSTYAAEDIAAEARSSGAGAYLNKEDVDGSVLRALWEDGGDPSWRMSSAADWDGGAHPGSPIGL